MPQLARFGPVFRARLMSAVSISVLLVLGAAGHAAGASTDDVVEPSAIRSNRDGTSIALAVGLSPFAAIRDLVDLPFRLLTLPMTLSSVTHANYPLFMPFFLLAGADAGLVFAGTDDGYEAGMESMVQPWRSCHGFAFFPNLRTVWPPDDPDEAAMRHRGPTASGCRLPSEKLMESTRQRGGIVP